MRINDERVWTWVTAEDRCELLSSGVVVIDDHVGRKGRRSVSVVSPLGMPALEAVGARFGKDVEIEYVGETHRSLRPRRCVGYMEREPGRLQVRYAFASEDHMDEVLCEEDGERVVVYGLVCCYAGSTEPEWREEPFHVYLRSALGGRTVVDGVTGEPIPYRNVYEEMAAEGLIAHPGGDDSAFESFEIGEIGP